jgi:hypothetical protein
MSSSLKKQITIDATSNQSHNATLKRQKKVKPPAALIRPSTARHNLLQKIKDYQRRNEETSGSQPSQTSQSSQPSQQSDKDLANQYKASANYLEQLMNKKKEARKHKSPKVPLQQPLQQPHLQMQPLQQPHQQPFQQPLQQPHLQMQPQMFQQVSLELPPELQLNPVMPLQMMSLPFNPMPVVDPPPMHPMPVVDPPPMPVVDPPPSPDEIVGDPNPNPNPNATANPIVLKDVPYGCLRGGNKPTYRTYHRAQPHNTTLKKTLFSDPPPVFNENENADPMIQERQRKLREIQENFHNQGQTPGQQQPPGQTEPTKLKNKIKQIITKKYKLGKTPGGNVVGVLIKNSDTRRRIQEEHGVLRRESIVEIRKYLHDHGLIKVGSDAPPDVLRNIYESAKMTGEISNTNKHVLLHNFMQPEKD